MNYHPGDQVIVTMPDGHELFGVVVEDERDAPTLAAINRGRVRVALGGGIEVLVPPSGAVPVAEGAAT